MSAPLDKAGDASCPWCGEIVFVVIEAWTPLRADTPDAAKWGGRLDDTWRVTCVSDHILWTQADESAHIGSDASAPYNPNRVLEILSRLHETLGTIPFTDLCAWCGDRTGTLIAGVEGSHQTYPCCEDCLVKGRHVGTGGKRLYRVASNPPRQRR